MGFLQVLFQSEINNPALLSAMEKYRQLSSDDNLVSLWQKFLHSKIVLATSPENARVVAKLKNMRDTMGLSFHTVSNEKNDSLLALYVDTETFKQAELTGMVSLVLRGEQAYELVVTKGFMGMVLNPKTATSTELKVWQHQIFIEKVADAMKLHSLATKLARAGYAGDSESVLKGAILASQLDPGAHHPFTAELNIELARALRAQHKLEQSEWAYKHALTIYETTGTSDLDVASTAEALSSLLCEMQRAPQAVPFMERALGIYERIPGGKPDAIARILCMIGEIKCESGKHDEGEQYYKRAVITLEERKHPDLLGVLLKLGDLCEKGDRQKEALAHYMRVVTLHESLKRAKDFDAAKAAHKAAALYMRDGKAAEAIPLLEKALMLFRKEDQHDLLRVANRLMDAAKESMDMHLQAERTTLPDPAKSGFARAAKRPADLPFLDMSAMRSNPKAKLAENAPTKGESVPVQTNNEEQALEQMKAFLDSVGKDGTYTQPVNRPAATANEPEPAIAHKPEPAKTQQAEPAIAHKPEPAKTQQAEPAIAQKAEPAITHQAEPAIASEPAPAAALETAANEPPAVKPAPTSIFEEDAITALFKGTVDKTPVRTQAALPPVPRGASLPPATPSTLSAAPVPPEAPEAKEVPLKPLSVAETSIAATEPTHSISDKQELGKSMADDISGIFNKSVLGDGGRSDRFDKAIGDRNAPKPAEDKPNLKLDSSRFDTPIQDRQKEVKAAPTSEPAADAPAQKPKFDPSRFDKPIQERKQDGPTADEGGSLFSDLDDSLTSAFNNLLAVTSKKEESRFDKPIQERQQSAPSESVSTTAAAAEAGKPSTDKEAASSAPEPAPVLSSTAVPGAALLNTAALPHSKLDISSVSSPEELLALLDSRLQNEPQNVDLWLRKGTALVQLQRLDEAIKVFDKATTLSPNDLKAWYCKGSSLQLKSKFEDAVYCFNYVLKLDGENIKSLMRKAECLVKLGRIDQGMTLYDRVITLQPKYVAGWLSKARAHVQQRRLQEAMTCYQTVLTIEADNEEALKAINLIATKLGATTQPTQP
jgi:tetratricopeptide (TPR) repeat protein